MKFFLPVVLCLLSSVVVGQVDLSVSVTNSGSLKPVTGKKLSLSNPEIGYSSEGVTNNQGRVIFKALALAGSYTVAAVDDSSFFGSQVENLQFRANENPSVNLVVTEKKSSTLNAVTVFSGSSKINTENAEVSAQLKRKELEDLPVEGRDITRALFRLPNVTQATGFYAEAPNVSINGSNSIFNSYLIDGMDNNERFLGGQKFAVPVGFTQNITVLTNNYSAEYGNTANGVINVTSRSGSNDNHGEVYYVTRPGPSIDGKTDFLQRDLTGNAVKSGFSRQQFGFAFGGALKKNKTFYFIDAEQTIDTKDNFLVVPQLGVNTSVRGHNYFTLLSGKIDQHWNSHFHSSLRGNVGIINVENQGGGLDGGVSFPSSGYRQDRNSLLIALENNYTTGHFAGETNVQFSRFHWNYDHPKNPNDPQVEVQDQTGTDLAILGNPGYIFNSIENTLQIQQKLKWFFNHHTLKVGGEVISAGTILYGGGATHGYYLTQLTATQTAALKAENKGKELSVQDIPSDANVLAYNVELRPGAFGKRQTISSIYAEDEFSVTPRLNLTYGFRYDYDNLSKGGAAHGDYNNFAPRVSVNYKLTDRSSLRIGTGLFYDKILYTIYSDALQQNTTGADYKTEIQALIDKGILPKNTNIGRVTFNGNLTASASNVSYLNGPSAASLQPTRDQAFGFERRILNPNGFQNPYNWQSTIGYQYQINSKLVFFTDVVYNRSYDLFRLKDLNAPSSYQIPRDGTTARSTTAADLTRPIPIITDASGSYAVINGQRVNGVARSITITDDGGRSEYIGLSVNLKKDKAGDNYAYFISYTLSSLKNNTDDVNFKASDANNFSKEWGPSLNDRRHVISGVFYYYPVRALSLTLATLIQSGQPVNRIPDATLYGGTTDLNGDGASYGDSYVGNSDRQPGESRNDDRLPWSKVFDIGAQYNLGLKASRRIEIRADVFNIFNTQNLSGYSNNATQSNQIQIGPKSYGILKKNAGPPRQFQFSARYAF